MANPTPPSPTALTPNLSTLQAIRTKVRRLTRTPSTAQMTDAELDSYVNTFVLYDFPEHLRTFNLRTQFTFYTNPGQDVYPTDIASYGGAINNALYNFQNLYLTIHPPVYIAGYQAFFTQSREQFYSIYPQINSIASIGTSGDGVTTSFSGVVTINGATLLPGQTQNVSLLQNQVLFSSIDIAGIGLAMVDVPVLDVTTGLNFGQGNLYDPNSAAYQAAKQTPPTTIDITNFINYQTGQFIVTFNAAPAAAAVINSQTVQTASALPLALLYYSNQFVVRPIPDQPYRINFEVYQRPTALLDAAGYPELEEYWQYIAYGASKKIFEDRMDMESVSMIMPEFKKQEALCLRRTIVQYTNERVATIYTESLNAGGNGNGWGWGGGSF